MKNSPTDLHAQFYFDFIEVSQSIEAKIKKSLKPYKLTHAQFNVLRILKGANTAIPAKTIKARMIVRKPDITRLIDRMIGKGLVTREINPSNKREVEISISKKGLEFVEKLTPLMTAVTHNFFINELKEDELLVLLKIFKKLKKVV